MPSKQASHPRFAVPVPRPFGAYVAIVSAPLGACVLTACAMGLGQDDGEAKSVHRRETLYRSRASSAVSQCASMAPCRLILGLRGFDGPLYGRFPRFRLCASKVQRSHTSRARYAEGSGLPSRRAATKITSCGSACTEHWHGLWRRLFRWRRPTVGKLTS